MSFFSAQWEEFRTFWRGSGFAAELRRSAAAAVLLALVGFGVCMALPDLLRWIMNLVQEYFSSLNLTDSAGNISAMALFSNNARACAFAMLYGMIPYAYLSALPLGVNFLLLGAMASYYVSNGQSLTGYAAALLPHGIFELPALVLSFAMGLYCCTQMTRRCRKDETAPRAADCIAQMSRLFALLIVPLLLAAALMEAYVTPLVASYFN